MAWNQEPKKALAIDSETCRSRDLRSKPQAQLLLKKRSPLPGRPKKLPRPEKIFGWTCAQAAAKPMDFHRNFILVLREVQVFILNVSAFWYLNTNRCPRPSKGWCLMVFKYSKASKKHPLEGTGPSHNISIYVYDARPTKALNGELTAMEVRTSLWSLLGRAETWTSACPTSFRPPFFCWAFWASLAGEVGKINGECFESKKSFFLKLFNLSPAVLDKFESRGSFRASQLRCGKVMREYTERVNALDKKTSGSQVRWIAWHFWRRLVIKRGLGRGPDDRRSHSIAENRGKRKRKRRRSRRASGTPGSCLDLCQVSEENIQKFIDSWMIRIYFIAWYM